MDVNLLCMMVVLEEKGYTHAPELLNDGGESFAMKFPDGRIIWEKDFPNEIKKLSKLLND